MTEALPPQDDVTSNQRPARTLEFKDALIVLPLIGTCFAISYELGSFASLGGIATFSLFSISEHIVFSLAAMPMAVLLALSLLPYSIFFKRLAESKLVHSWKRRRDVPLFLPVVGFLTLATAGLTAAGWHLNSVTLVGASAILLPATIGFIAAPETIAQKPVIPIIWGFTAAMLLTFSFGVDNNRLPSGNVTSNEIVLDDGPRSAILLRAGDKGILFYDSSKQRVDFRRWEAVKAVSWPSIDAFERTKDMMRSRRIFPLGLLGNSPSRPNP